MNKAISYSPNSLNELINLSKNLSEFTVIAGGTDIMPKLNRYELYPAAFLDITRIDELKKIYEKDEFIKIGAGVTLSTISQNDSIRKYFPALHSASSLIGSVQIRNRATLIGNVANMSPAADSMPPLLIYNPTFEVILNGELSLLSLNDLITTKNSSRKFIVLSIIINKNKANFKSFFLRQGTRNGMGLALASLAFGIETDDLNKISDVRIAAGAVAPTPFRCSETESFMRGKEFSKELFEKASVILLKEIKPIDDIRASASFRKDCIKNMFLHFYTQATVH